MNTSEVASLIALADEILAKDGGALHDIVLLEQYAKRFDEWFQEAETTISEMLKEEVTAERLLELFERHKQILGRAEAMRSDTSQSIRDLKRKAKGILAYVDVLPKSVSTRRPKKG